MQEPCPNDEHYHRVYQKVLDRYKEASKFPLYDTDVTLVGRMLQDMRDAMAWDRRKEFDAIAENALKQLNPIRPIH